MTKQPKSLYLLNFVSMWECFSYYGMRSLLVLYLVHVLGYSDDKAFMIYALYTTLVECGGIVGGYAADKFFGQKLAIFIGGSVIALGHIVMAMGFCFIGLATIVVGTSLFRPNCTALVGQCYDDDDPRRDAGYTIFYTGINIGGFLAALSCGFVGERYGWELGFGLAAVGMVAGLVTLMLGRSLLVTKKAAPDVGRGVVYKQLFACMALLALFYGCEEQLGSTMVLFGDRHVDRGIMPAASLVMLNPLTILLAGPFIKRVLLTARMKLFIGFLLLAAAFCLLGASCQQIVPLAYVVVAIVLISLGELFVGPTILVAASKLAPEGKMGVTMGAVSLGFSAANLFSGLLSQMMTVHIAEESVAIYTRGFLTIGVGALLFSLLLLRGVTNAKVYV